MEALNIWRLSPTEVSRDPHTIRPSGGMDEGKSDLFAYADPTQLRVWADADDLFVPALWPEFVENLNHRGLLWMGFYEVWGDHRHTTQFGFYAVTTAISRFGQERGAILDGAQIRMVLTFHSSIAPRRSAHGAAST